MNDTLPPFSGDNPQCPKCGNEEADTRYLAHGQCAHPDTSIGWQPNPRLHRTCTRCDYQWDEATVETAADKETSA